MKLEQIKQKLEALAKRKTWTEDSEESGEEFMNPQDMSGGNYDDCYQGGKDDGETELAREILEIINKE